MRQGFIRLPMLSCCDSADREHHGRQESQTAMFTSMLTYRKDFLTRMALRAVLRLAQLSPGESWLECHECFCRHDGQCSNSLPSLIYLTVQIYSVFVSSYLCIPIALLSSCITFVLLRLIQSLAFNFFLHSIQRYIYIYTHTNRDKTVFSVLSDLCQ